MLSFIEIIRRAETGPMTTEKDFGLMISRKTMELCKEYDIKYNPEEIIPSDNSLADDVWNAGLELFLHTGVYYSSTRRIIKFTEEEVKEALKYFRENVEVGEGRDRIRFIHRQIEDKRPMIIGGGTSGTSIDPDMLIKLNQAFAQEPWNDIMALPGRVEKAFGLMVRENSPLQIYFVRIFAERLREVLENAGRPGMPTMIGIAAGVTGVADLVADEYLRPHVDIRCLMVHPDLRVDDDQLSKAVHWKSRGFFIWSGGTPLVGSWCGGPEGTALECIAFALAQLMVYKADLIYTGANHITYHAMTNPPTLWTTSVAVQALARNTRANGGPVTRTFAGPGTEQVYYELAAYTIVLNVSGSGAVIDPRMALPRYANQVSPLETRLMAEVNEAVSGMKREDANEIVKAICAKYKDYMDIHKAPIGKTFEQLYDLENLQPKEEALKVYEKAKKELENLGLKFK